MKNLHIPENVGLVRHADYTGTPDCNTRLTDPSLAFLIRNINDLADRLEQCQRLVIYHSPRQRAVLTANAFREVFTIKHITIETHQMSILDVDKRILTRQAVENEILFAGKEGVNSFYLFVTHEPVLKHYFEQQDQATSRIPVQTCEIITADFTIAGHFSH